MPNQIILAVTNDLSGDQRLHRIATALTDAGHRVTVVGRRLPDSLPLKERGYQTHRMHLLFRRGKLFYLEYNLRLFFLLLFRKADIITANDLDTLLGAWCAARLKRTELIYDSHEYFTEVPELIDRKLTRSMWLRLEKMLFPHLKKVYTVNGSLAGIYSKKYNVPVQVIRNLPFASELSADTSREPIILYQGSLNVGRGIELMIDAMEHLPDYRLLIIGRGDIEAKLKQQAVIKNLTERVQFRGFVPLEDLSLLTRQARLGLSLEEDLGANYRYASPNKVYDYIQAGVPVLVADLPEMRALVESYPVGVILPADQRKPQALAQKIEKMLKDETAYQHWVNNCRKAAIELNWEREKEKLLEIYNS